MSEAKNSVAESEDRIAVLSEMVATMVSNKVRTHRSIRRFSPLPYAFEFKARCCYPALLA